MRFIPAPPNRRRPPAQEVDSCSPDVVLRGCLPPELAPGALWSPSVPWPGGRDRSGASRVRHPPPKKTAVFTPDSNSKEREARCDVNPGARATRTHCRSAGLAILSSPRESRACISALASNVDAFALLRRSSDESSQNDRMAASELSRPGSASCLAALPPDDFGMCVVLRGSYSEFKTVPRP